MPIAPPPENLLDQPALELMDLYGRMRSLTESAGFAGTLPAIWQCSDESQGIKKALMGYVFDCPVFNLGRVGALLDPTRLGPASNHGQDLVILGGSHLGLSEEGGIGHIERVNGRMIPCCGTLARVLGEYLQLYRRAASLMTLSRGVGGIKVEIPYKYLFRTVTSENAQIHILLNQLVDGNALAESSQGKVYRLNSAFAQRHQRLLAEIGSEARPIGEMLDPQTFAFSKRLDWQSLDPQIMLEVSIFDFLPEIVTSPHPHRRLANVHTWRQFHRSPV